METISLKALSTQRLQGNRQGNHKETGGGFQGNFQETSGGNSDRLEREYFHLLARYWLSREDETALTMDETARLLERLDGLFRTLRRDGRKVPIRLPAERGPAGETLHVRRA